MGTDSLFWGPFRTLYVKDSKLAPDHFYAVDGSVLLYTVSRRGLGFETFVSDPQDDNVVEKLADAWVAGLCDCEEMLALTRSNVDKSRIRMFFESRADKSRHNRQTERRIKKIKKALKSMMEIQAPQFRRRAEAKARKLISSVFGRPAWWLTVIIAKKLEQLGFNIDLDAETESDHRITRWAVEMASLGEVVSVISIDSDDLAFAPPGSIAQMASSVSRAPGQIQAIKKSDILRVGDMTDLQLVIAFCLAGSDNIATHIEGMGWYRSVRYVKSRIPANWTAAIFAQKSPMKRLPGLIKWRNAPKENVTNLANEIRHKLKHCGWLSGELTPSTMQPGHLEKPTESDLFRFAFEMDGKNQLVRPRIAGLVWQKHRNDLGRIRSNQIQKQVEDIDRKYLEQKEAQARGTIFFRSAT